MSLSNIYTVNVECKYISYHMGNMFEAIDTVGAYIDLRWLYINLRDGKKWKVCKCGAIR